MTPIGAKLAAVVAGIRFALCAGRELQYNVFDNGVLVYPWIAQELPEEHFINPEWVAVGPQPMCVTMLSPAVEGCIYMERKPDGSLHYVYPDK